jgi:hypothetical protein
VSNCSCHTKGSRFEWDRTALPGRDSLLSSDTPVFGRLFSTSALSVPFRPPRHNMNSTSMTGWAARIKK